MKEEERKVEIVQKKTGLAANSVMNTLALIDEGATIPFIARYRKERTGSLDEVEILAIAEAYQSFKELILRKEFILKTIEEQKKLSPSLRSQIESCWDSTLLEDIYLPYKRKKSSRAEQARALGLEELAEIIFRSRARNLSQTTRQFLSKEVKTIEDALAGARDIIAEIISEHKTAREIAREVFQRTATLDAQVIKSKKDVAQLYKNYFEFNQSLTKVPSHRFLAIYRGEQEKFLRVKILIDEERLESRLTRYFIKQDSECGDQVKLAIQDCMKRLLIPSMSNEARKAAKEKADEEAISVFSNNLNQLLLAPPLGEKNILAIDPGFRTGCKVVVLDDQGNFLRSTTIFPHPPQSKEMEARSKIESLIEKHPVQAIAIGNGTAGRETLRWLESFLKGKIELYLVNESGASIYSASAVAREEFPDLDLTIRGAISIGRRLMDPLAELVKIDAKSIGVGQYQHDVNQSKLKSKLDQEVINCVNKVGININTASHHLLSYVSGLGPTVAQNIVDYRQTNNGIHSRKDLKNVPRMGAKAYEQSAGFLRVKHSNNPLDNTAVHPEAYSIVKKMASDLKVKVSDFLEDPLLIDKIEIKRYVSPDFGLPTLIDIVAELKKPGLDPRGNAEVFHFTEGIRSIQDLVTGIKIKGIVNNLTKFGAFVDVGIKESGLIHISQITNKYISDPSEVLSLGQEVEAMVIDLDISRKRISLSLKF